MSDKTVLKAIEKVLSSRADTAFRPTNDQKRIKSQFWASVRASSINLSVNPDSSIAASYIDLGTNWEVPGFSQWLWDEKSFDTQADYLAQVSMDELERLLTSHLAAPTVKLGAIKLALEVARKLGKTNDSPEFADSKIGEMDKRQLEEYINKSLKLVSPEIKVDNK